MRRVAAPAAVGLVVVLALLGWWLAGPGGTAETVAPSVRPTAASSVPVPSATPATDPEPGLAYVELAALPTEARRTVRLIDAGGPFPYAKDGAVFGNFEGVLPAQRRGWYHEYTVPTPGSRDRGARRIVTGDDDRQFFYTDDHYASFRRIRR